MEKSVSSRYQQGKHENRALTPRSGFDTGMSFSFSSFGDEHFSIPPIDQQPFTPIRIPFNTSGIKPVPINITPSFFQEGRKDSDETKDESQHGKAAHIYF